MSVTTLPTSDPEVLQILEAALKAAKSGRGQAVAVVLVCGDEIQTTLYGDLIALNYGIDMLKARVFDE